MAVREDWRNQYTDALPTKAAKTIQHPCEGGCGAWVPKRKRFCGSCYDTRLEANIAANRAKYAGRKYGKAKN